MTSKKDKNYKILISLVFGIIGFTLNFFPLKIIYSQFSTFLFTGLLFPLIITLAWGWKYGLISSVFGLGCQSLWFSFFPKFGWLAVIYVLLYNLWIFWHGFFSDFFKKKDSFFLRPYIVEIPFRIINTLILFLFFFFLNNFFPPNGVDYSKSIYINYEYMSFVIISNVIFSYILLLISDILFNISFLRRFFKLREKLGISNTNYIIIAAILLIVFFWGIDALTDYRTLYQNEKTFLELLTKPSSNILIMRIIFTIICMAGGLILSKLLSRHYKTEEKYRLLVETMYDGLAVLDKNGIFIYVNESLCRIFGYTSDEILGKKLISFLNKKNKKILLKQIDERKNGQTMSYEIEWIGKNKKRVYTTVAPRLLYDDKKNLVGSFAVITDISERKKAEDILTKTEEKHRAILNAIPDTILYVNKDGDIIELKGKIENFIVNKEVLDENTNIKDVLSPEIVDIIMKNLKLTLNSKEISRFNFHQVFNKNVFFYEARMVQSRKDEVLIIIHDITKRELLTIEQERLNAELIEKNSDLEQIIYVTSHDLRSPLVNILGFAKELNLSIDELKKIISNSGITEKENSKINNILDEDIIDSLNYITNSGKKMDILLNGLLKISRIGKTQPNIIEINMNQLVKEVVGYFEFKIKENNIKINLSNLPSCKGDYSQINQIFSNLIDNAIKYYDPDKESFINIHAKKQNDKIVYCIADNGIGIPNEHLKKIFLLFHRVNPGSIQGEGLGLSIVNKMVLLNNGKIWVESTFKEGSCFYISLDAV